MRGWRTGLAGGVGDTWQEMCGASGGGDWVTKDEGQTTKSALGDALWHQARGRLGL